MVAPECESTSSPSKLDMTMWHDATIYVKQSGLHSIWGASSSKSNTVLCRRRERNESSLNTHSWTCKLLSWCIRYTRALEANQFYAPLASGLALRNCKNYIYMKCRSNPMGNSGLRSHPVRSLIFDIVFPTDMAPSKQMHKSLTLMLMQYRCIFYTLKPRTWY